MIVISCSLERKTSPSAHPVSLFLRCIWRDFEWRCTSPVRLYTLAAFAPVVYSHTGHLCLGIAAWGHFSSQPVGRSLHGPVFVFLLIRHCKDGPMVWLSLGCSGMVIQG